MPQSNTHQNNILVVDDTPENLTMLTQMLTSYGYLVRPAINGQVALRAVQKDQPDLILLDIMMPNLSGYEVCERLKANERTRDIPVIFISALNEVFDKVKAFTLGGVDYITKPFQVKEVLARVETHLALRNLHRELQEKNIQLQQEITEHKRTEEALKESMTQIERAKKEWESTADSLSYVVCLLDNQRRIIRANRAVEHWKLGQVIDVKGREMHELFHPDCTDSTCYLETFLSYAWQEISQGVSAGCEASDPVLRRYLSVQVRPISGQIEREYKQAESFAVGIVTDITERKQAEDSLRQRNHDLVVLNQMNDLFQACHSEEETYKVVTGVCEELFPLDSGSLYMIDASKTMLTKVASWGSPPCEKQSFAINDCWSLRYDKVHLVENSHIKTLCSHLSSPPDNGYLCIPIRTSEQILGTLTLYFSQCEPSYSDDEYKRLVESRHMVVTRVTEHYALFLVSLRLRETLRIESIRDPLTNLYNRRYMEEALERETQRAKRRGTPVGIIMFDIDHFKHLNDTYGHEVGDLVLQDLGDLFRRHTRSEDIACRYGGEEFLLIMPEASLKAVKQRAEELRIVVKERLQIPWQKKILSITISVGVAEFPNHGSRVKDVVNAADTALYQAKERGRDQVVVAPPE
jgi:diguanylate cyclase (GGDEF)-like protein